MRGCKRFFAVALVLIVIGFLFGISFPAIGAEKDQATDKPIITFKPLKSPVTSTPVEPTATKSTNVKRSAAKRAAVKPEPVEVAAAKPAAAETAPVKQPPANCKYATTLDKADQVVYMPAGKECEELLKDFTSQSKSCCVCVKDSSALTLACKGACCPVMFDKVGIKR